MVRYGSPGVIEVRELPAPAPGPDEVLVRVHATVDHVAVAAVPSQFPPANIRVMVPNVDEKWRLAIESGGRIVVPIDDRYYGLRDFTIADPDGFGIRFASILEPPWKPVGGLTGDVGH